VNEEQTQRIMEKVRARVDEHIESYILADYTEEMGYKILAYCTRNDIPGALELVWVRMVIDLLESTGKQYVAKQGVSEISEGDMKLKYEAEKSSVGVNASLVDSVVLNYQIDLNRFRQLKGLGR
jgi:hypothetical protein